MINLRNKPFLVNKENPFLNDLLNREDEIVNLTTLIENTQSPSVFAINSKWGDFI